MGVVCGNMGETGCFGLKYLQKCIYLYAMEAQGLNTCKNAGVLGAYAGMGRDASKYLYKSRYFPKMPV